MPLRIRSEYFHIFDDFRHSVFSSLPLVKKVIFERRRFICRWYPNPALIFVQPSLGWFSAMASQDGQPVHSVRGWFGEKYQRFLKNVPLFGDPGDFAPGGVQLGLEIGGRAGVNPGHRFGPGTGSGKTHSAGIEPVGQQPQFPGDHRSRLALLSQFRTASRLKVSSNYGGF